MSGNYETSKENAPSVEEKTHQLEQRNVGIKSGRIQIGVDGKEKWPALNVINDNMIGRARDIKKDRSLTVLRKNVLYVVPERRVLMEQKDVIRIRDGILMRAARFVIDVKYVFYQENGRAKTAFQKENFMKIDRWFN